MLSEALYSSEILWGFFGQVFMKERERQLLQDLLHQEVLRRITLLQRWFRSMLCRRQFLSLRQAVVIIQVGMMVPEFVVNYGPRSLQVL